MSSHTIQEVSGAELDQQVAAVPGVLVVEFYATWCGNCRRLEPVLDRLAGEYADRAQFVKVNVEERLEAVVTYGVSSTPTLIRLDGGRAMTAPLVGAQPESVLRDWLDTPAPAVPGTSDRRWVPADACTLPSADQPLRVAEFGRLFRESLRDVRRPSATRLRLELDAAAEVAAQSLIARETDCCDFFSFTLTRPEGGSVWMDIEVPNERSGVLDGLAEQAATARVA